MEECIFLGKKRLMRIDHPSDGGVQLPGQEMVNEYADSSDTPQDRGVRWGKITRTVEIIC